MTFLDRLVQAVVRELLRRPRRHRGRRRCRTAVSAPDLVCPPPFPAQFESREEWLAWCEQDRRAEAAEMLDDVRSDALTAAGFEARHEVDPPAAVRRFCHRHGCGHEHGGRAYGLCLIAGCECVEVQDEPLPLEQAA